MIIRVDENGKVTNIRNSVESIESLPEHIRHEFSDYQNYTGEIPEGEHHKLANGIMIVDVTAETKAKQEKLIRDFTDLIDVLIASKITEYNEANNVKYQNINSFPKYIHDTTLPQYAVSKAFLDWNSILWETARSIQSDVLAGNREIPTESELLAELPELVI